MTVTETRDGSRLRAEDVSLAYDRGVVVYAVTLAQ